MSLGANPQALSPGKGGVTGQGVSVLPPQGRVQSSTPPSPKSLHSLPIPSTVRCTEKLFIYMYKCLFSNSSPPIAPLPPSMAIASAPSTLYIMYRKSLCMVEGGRGGFRELGDPSPQAPLTGQDLC